MTSAIDHLAALTAYRDRDQLDVTLAQSLMDLLQPLQVSIHKLVGEADDARWLLRASITTGDPVPRTDPAWLDVQQLPERASAPHRSEALDTGRLGLSLQLDHHVACFPVTVDDEANTVIEIHTAVPLPAQQQRMVTSILRIYRNFESLLNYSEHDTLTGLLNRKTFDSAFQRLAEPPPAVPLQASPERRTDGEPSRAWLGILDIDHFKRVNDRFGHLIGDEVLLLIARILRTTFRYRDQLFRFGGEEFVVLLYCHCEDDALAAFERLRRNVEAFDFPQVGHITVSIGMTEARASDTPVSAFERADRAVYFAKDEGRNRICSHQFLVDQGFILDDDKSGDVELF
jgi:diguanylate cyclase (GGDEF)-like protein